MTVGIICEYNPFHNGHFKQIKSIQNPENALVCLMSGNFVQRGAPAIIDKRVDFPHPFFPMMPKKPGNA